MKRKIYNEILKWKEESKGKSALLIEGARRVGKSYISLEFAKENYKSFILIDFSKVSDEIKKTANPQKSMINNFKVLENKKLNVGNGGLICFYPEIIPLDEKNKSYPISVIF